MSYLPVDSTLTIVSLTSTPIPKTTTTKKKCIPSWLKEKGGKESYIPSREEEKNQSNKTKVILIESSIIPQLHFILVCIINFSCSHALDRPYALDNPLPNTMTGQKKSAPHIELCIQWPLLVIIYKNKKRKKKAYTFYNVFSPDKHSLVIGVLPDPNVIDTSFMNRLQLRATTPFATS